MIVHVDQKTSLCDDNPTIKKDDGTDFDHFLRRLKLGTANINFQLFEQKCIKTETKEIDKLTNFLVYDFWTLYSKNDCSYMSKNTPLSGFCELRI